MSLRTTKLTLVACAHVFLSAVTTSAQLRLKGRVHTPGDDPLVAREQVTIEGAGQYRTDDHGEFEFDLAGDLKVGGEARFHVYHVNSAISIQQWIVIKPCDTENGKTLSLPAVGSRPIPILVLPKGDQRLISLNRDYSILGCTIEEAASQFRPASRSLEPNRSSSLFGSGSSLLARQVPYRTLYESPTTRDFPRLVEASYRVTVADQFSISSSLEVQDSRLLDEAFLAKKAVELGFAPKDLADALNVWARSAEDSYQKGLAALYEGRYQEASGYISASIPSPPGEFLNRYVPLARAESEQGHYSAAEAALRKVLAVHSEDPQILNNLGEVLSDEGKYAEAEPLLKRALTIAEETLGPDHPSLGKYLTGLAGLYFLQGESWKAEPLVERALTIDKKTLGPDQPEVAAGLNNLAAVYVSQGRYAEAEPLYKQAITINEKALGPNHPTLAKNLHNLARLYYSQGKYVEAESLYKQALAVDETALGPEHPMVATILDGLAKLDKSQGKYTEAELLYKRALTIDEKTLGPDDMAVAIDMNDLAELYKSEGRYAEAEPLYKHALTIAEKTLGPHHSSVATIAENLAEDLRKLGRDAEAKIYEDQAREIISFEGIFW